MSALNWLPAFETVAGVAPGLYLALFAAPFVQEDAAIVGAAAASAAAQGEPVAIFASVLIGLVISDAWKYWLGRLAHRSPWASRFVAGPRIARAAAQVARRTGAALVISRFIPGTRIPLYIACGYFRVRFARFVCLIAVSGALYAGAAFATAHGLAALIGSSIHV